LAPNHFSYLPRPEKWKNVNTVMTYQHYRQEISTFSENFTHSPARQPERKRRDPGTLSVGLTSEFESEAHHGKENLVGAVPVPGGSPPWSLLGLVRQRRCCGRWPQHQRAPQWQWGEEIRIYGIECPEKGQDFGTKAQHVTSILLFAKVVAPQRILEQVHCG
jgi:hypothetical protein